MLGATIKQVARHNYGGDGVEPVDDFPRFDEPPHKGVARSETAIGSRKIGIVLDRKKKFWHRLIEAPAEEMRASK